MNETLTPQIEVQPIEQAPLPAAKPPKFIKVTITEEDRQNADAFIACRGCLIWTALTRTGYKNVHVGPHDACIDGHEYKFDCECARADALEAGDYDWDKKPHYDPLVVGKVISCTLIENE